MVQCIYFRIARLSQEPGKDSKPGKMIHGLIQCLDKILGEVDRLLVNFSTDLYRQCKSEQKLTVPVKKSRKLDSLLGGSFIGWGVFACKITPWSKRN